RPRRCGARAGVPYLRTADHGSGRGLRPARGCVLRDDRRARLVARCDRLRAADLRPTSGANATARQRDVAGSDAGCLVAHDDRRRQPACGCLELRARPEARAARRDALPVLTVSRTLSPELRLVFRLADPTVTAAELQELLRAI